MWPQRLGRPMLPPGAQACLSSLGPAHGTLEPRAQSRTEPLQIPAKSRAGWRACVRSCVLPQVGYRPRQVSSPPSAEQAALSSVPSCARHKAIVETEIT